MGRIKSTAIKKAGRQISAANPTLFSEDFNVNKLALRNTMPSKPIRNKVAGYISRLVKMQNKPRKKKEIEPNLLESSENKIGQNI